MDFIDAETAGEDVKDFLISHVKYNIQVVERILQEESDSISTLFLVYSNSVAKPTLHGL